MTWISDYELGEYDYELTYLAALELVKTTGRQSGQSQTDQARLYRGRIRAGQCSKGQERSDAGENMGRKERDRAGQERTDLSR